jgi:hypothetical protein
MTTKPATVLSPTVMAVFTDFLSKLEKDDALDKQIATRLRNVLIEAKEFDPSSIRRAVLGEEIP